MRAAFSLGLSSSHLHLPLKFLESKAQNAVKSLNLIHLSWPSIMSQSFSVQVDRKQFKLKVELCDCFFPKNTSQSKTRETSNIWKNLQKILLSLVKSHKNSLGYFLGGLQTHLL